MLSISLTQKVSLFQYCHWDGTRFGKTVIPSRFGRACRLANLNSGAISDNCPDAHVWAAVANFNTDAASVSDDGLRLIIPFTETYSGNPFCWVNVSAQLLQLSACSKVEQKLRTV